MTRLTIEDARVLLSTLEDVQRAALRTAPAGPDALPSSPPMAELRCLLVEAASIHDVETHLWTVGALALRDIAVRVYMRTWNIGPRTFPHKFERLLERRPGEQPGDPYPYLVLDGIAWSEDLAHLPRVVWITHREMRLCAGAIEDRARAALSARYPVAALRWRLRTATSLGPGEME
jgi:hypothetical protein